jgi:hydrogenase-4 component J
MGTDIVFYHLGQKIVNNQESIPENARQVLYYSLAIGHHVGVMDCFSILMRMPLASYEKWIAGLPPGAGKNKLEGVLKWGEIEINGSHVGELISALNTNPPAENTQESQYTHTLQTWLEKIIQEPALYLMVRKTS